MRRFQKLLRFLDCTKDNISFQDSPESRRGFLDQMICSINNLYKNNLQIYQKYKKERIRLLKNLSEETSEWLDIIEKNSFNWSNNM